MNLPNMTFIADKSFIESLSKKLGDESLAERITAVALRRGLMTICKKGDVRAPDEWLLDPVETAKAFDEYDKHEWHSRCEEGYMCFEHDNRHCNNPHLCSTVCGVEDGTTLHVDVTVNR